MNCAAFALAASILASTSSTVKPRHLRPASLADPEPEDALRRAQLAPTVDTVRAAYKTTFGEEISEQVAKEAFRSYLRARDGRTGPIFANHSLPERTTNLQRSFSSRRRRAQIADAPDQESDLITAPNVPSSTCSDHLATNIGQPSSCTYTCQDLILAYFPEPQSHTTRCFFFDPTTETWPESGGAGAELLAMRERYHETHVYISQDNTTNGISWSIGEGRVCRNVTINTIIPPGAMPSHTEEVCLLDGEHEYNHTITSQHSIEVVGYVEPQIHPGAGGQTEFVVGKCTDVLIRVSTSTSGGGSITWTLDDGGHNGPWHFETGGEVGVDEFETCMFDNLFTLERAATSSWQGTIEVVGFIHYHNTITVPVDENWIVQGAIDQTTGLPAVLDARLKSGSAHDRSRASIIVRHVRISNQVAPVDVNTIDRDGFTEGMTAGFGGAFEYDGGSDDPSNLVKIAFFQVIFDHNYAGTSGGALLIDGRGGMLDGNGVQNWNSGINLTIDGVTFFRNTASQYNGGAWVAQNFWPSVITVRNTTYIENEAFSCSHEVTYWMSAEGPDLRVGDSTLSFTDVHYEGGYSTLGLHAFAGVSWHFAILDISEPEAHWEFSFERCTWEDHAAFIINFIAAGSMYGEANMTWVDCTVDGAVTLSTFLSQRDSQIWAQGITDSMTIVRSSLLRSGNFLSGATGPGGVALEDMPTTTLPTVEVLYSAFIENSGGKGPALSTHSQQPRTLQISSCLFQGNVAFVSGGAIFIQGPEDATLAIHSSIFESNAVSVPTTTKRMDVTVLLNTGGIGIGTGVYAFTDDSAVPIWRIDDGPVYGIPWEMCQRAAQHSQAAVAQGLSSSWPNGNSCGNITHFGPMRTYSQVVNLLEGPHVLWTGMLMDSTYMSYPLGWSTGWIEIVGFLDPVFPSPETDPSVAHDQFSGCTQASTECYEAHRANIETDGMNCCPRGLAIWSSYAFEVSSGTGGAANVFGEQTVSISDSVFRSNTAPMMNALIVTGAESIRITNTTIDGPGELRSEQVETVSTTIDTCFENPCAPGEGCTFVHYSTFCESCRQNEIGEDGISCETCPPGTQPDSSGMMCLPCPVGHFSQIGLCTFCPAGKSSTDDQTGCADCPPGTFRGGQEPDCHSCPAGSQPNTAKTGCDSCTLTGPFAFSPDGHGCQNCPTRHSPNYERTACFCQTETYSSVDIGLVICHGTSYTSSGVATDECAVCPSCLDCTRVGEIWLQSGWAFHGDGDAYRCPGAEKFEACPALLLNRNASMDSSTCAEGYEGPVCGNCEPDFNHLTVGSVCKACNDGVINVPLVLVLFCAALAIAVAVISGAANVLEDFGIVTDCRIIISFYQILGQAGNVLDVKFPTPVPQLVDFVKLLFLDIRKLVMLDCWNIGGLYGTVVTNVVVVPTIIFGICMIIYVSQKRTLMAVIASGASDSTGLNTIKVKLKNNLAVGLFLVYPTITTTLFRIPQCRSLGEASFHEDDYSIDCGSTEFFLTVLIAVLAIILVPFGVPAAFMYFMLQAKKRIGGIVNETALGGAKLTQDKNDEADTYRFLVKDYLPRYWYHEMITYSRKLMLGGISIVMGRGTIAQAYFVITTEAFYLMHHMRTYPFVVYKHNLMEALGHCAIMLLYAITLILRKDSTNDWASEWFPKEGYGWFIVFLFAIVLPSPSIIFYFRDKEDYQTRIDDGAIIENPLEMGHDFDSETARSVDSVSSQQQPSASSARSKLSKAYRETKYAQAQVQRLEAETRQQQAKIEQQQTQIEKLQSQAQMTPIRSDGPPTDEHLLVQNGSTSTINPGEAETVMLSELVANEVLGEDARESAKRALTSVASAQITEFEQSAVAKIATQSKARLVHSELTDWLVEHRLQQYAAQFTQIGGVNTTPSDLQFFTEKDVEQLGNTMNRIERQRLRVAWTKIRDQHADINNA